MRYHSIVVRWLQLGANTDGEAYISILGVETVDWFGALLHWERTRNGRHMFDVAYMREALFALRDKWNDRA